MYIILYSLFFFCLCLSLSLYLFLSLSLSLYLFIPFLFLSLPHSLLMLHIYVSFYSLSLSISDAAARNVISHLVRAIHELDVQENQACGSGAESKAGSGAGSKPDLDPKFGILFSDRRISRKIGLWSRIRILILLDLDPIKSDFTGSGSG